jgi:hypothetical protein
MRIDLMASQEVGEGTRDTHMSETEVEYLGDFAELLLQFTRALGYTYVKQIVFVKDDDTEIGSIR